MTEEFSLTWIYVSAHLIFKEEDYISLNILKIVKNKRVKLIRLINLRNKFLTPLDNPLLRTIQNIICSNRDQLNGHRNYYQTITFFMFNLHVDIFHYIYPNDWYKNFNVIGVVRKHGLNIRKLIVHKIFCFIFTNHRFIDHYK